MLLRNTYIQTLKVLVASFALTLTLTIFIFPSGEVRADLVTQSLGKSERSMKRAEYASENRWSLEEEPKIDFSLLMRFNIASDDVIFPFGPEATPNKRRTFGNKVKAKTKTDKESETVSLRGGRKKKGTLIFIEGSGSRGGGSGVAHGESVERAQKVEALEVYRSRHLDQFPDFFKVDPILRAWVPANQSSNGYTANWKNRWSESLIDEVMNRFKVLLPVLYSSLSQARKDFAVTTWTDTEQRIPLINDYAGTNLNLKDSHQVQIVYRVFDRFVYDKYLYDKMDPFNQAALKLHEFIYAVSRHEDSIMIQRLVSLLLSPQLGKDLSKISQYLAKEISTAEINEVAILKLILSLNLGNVQSSSTNELPLGLHQSDQLPTDFGNCGLLEDLTVTTEPAVQKEGLFVMLDSFFTMLGSLISSDSEPEKPTLTGIVKLQVHSTIGSFNFSDLLPSARHRIWLTEFSERKTIELKDRDSVIAFSLALYLSKSTLSRAFPNYKFPAQTVARSIICFNQDQNEIVGVWSALFLNRTRNQHKLNYAAAEIRYIQSVAKARALWRRRQLAPSKADRDFLSKELQQSLETSHQLGIVAQSQVQRTITSQLDRITSMINPSEEIEVLSESGIIYPD